MSENARERFERTATNPEKSSEDASPQKPAPLAEESQSEFMRRLRESSGYDM